MDNKRGSQDAYQSGYRYGRRDGHYARLFGRMPFVRIGAAEVRAWSRVNSHRHASRDDRAYWLGYARGLSSR